MSQAAQKEKVEACGKLSGLHLVMRNRKKSLVAAKPLGTRGILSARDPVAKAPGPCEPRPTAHAHQAP
jgi:hypothetical protein